MNAYAYEMTITTKTHENIIKTNDILEIMHESRERLSSDNKITIIDGYTGEILMYFDLECDRGIYMTNEFRLMWLGFKALG